MITRKAFLLGVLSLPLAAFGLTKSKSLAPTKSDLIPNPNGFVPVDLRPSVWQPKWPPMSEVTMSEAVRLNGYPEGSTRNFDVPRVPNLSESNPTGRRRIVVVAENGSDRYRRIFVLEEMMELVPRTPDRGYALCHWERKLGSKEVFRDYENVLRSRPIRHGGLWPRVKVYEGEIFYGGEALTWT